jgi:hydrogenase maturation protease
MCMSYALVLGVGNTLLQDDGAGVHAAMQLAARDSAARNLRVLDAGTVGFALLPELEGCDSLLVFDAARAGATSGAVSLREGAAMDAFVRRSHRSVHELGLSDLLDMARLSGCLPARRALVGIEPGTIDWGVGCTAAVAGALPAAVDTALAVLARWQDSGPTEHNHAA